MKQLWNIYLSKVQIEYSPGYDRVEHRTNLNKCKSLVVYKVFFPPVKWNITRNQ